MLYLTLREAGDLPLRVLLELLFVVLKSDGFLPDLNGFENYFLVVNEVDTESIDLFFFLLLNPLMASISFSILLISYFLLLSNYLALIPRSVPPPIDLASSSEIKNISSFRSISIVSIRIR